MARIIDSMTGARRTIQLSTDDIIAVVQEYQSLVHKYKQLEDIRDILENRVLYLPEG